ncbi:glycosyltransferase [Chitinophaga horti]|uniref:Glycosyltransferase n=1 Tax=Chitinophaga horti TaxID=2920382 RepID=A0ABY6J4S2_9BACT|nr:nucleotide disphospho-sugar-binding domain-containing protein [Chitinophaga horti]UYQ94603.1 glycosyltransferase [Chitinophaga horti]
MQPQERKKILFANMAADGHFNPLTGIAAWLRDQGHDVRWYTSKFYEEKIQRMNIPTYRYKRALEVSAENMDEVFPDREENKGKLAKLKYDMKNFFILRGPEFAEDIKEIYEEFAFDVLVADILFVGAPLVREALNVPTVIIGVCPLMESSRDLPPTGMGMVPASNFLGRVQHQLLRWFARKVIFKEVGDFMNEVYARYGIAPVKGVLFDGWMQKSDLLLQSGVPGFEFKRSDMNPNVRFVGALLPEHLKQAKPFKLGYKLAHYNKVILVTQGTAERDVEKLLVPVLEAYKNTRYLVVATTGGSRTQELRERYPFDNIIVEDFINFNEIMPLADVYVTNGGYGGVMLAIHHGLPMVLAGIHEGKSEITARAGYFGLGVNLRTETPSVSQLRGAVEKVLKEETYRTNVAKLGAEFAAYDTNRLCEQHIMELLDSRAPKVRRLSGQFSLS